MQSNATPGPASPAGSPLDRLRHLPAEAQASFTRFTTQGDLDALDPVILAILQDYIPRQPAKPLAEHPGHTLLMEDLGFDSLAITEVIFFTEELLNISISNEEILQVRTLDDLRAFVRRKVTERLAA